ncbi:hypothetical protein [Maribellus sp. YY47]|uniref:hypothetical protein n=1 Tax=Maribellus sp. YY47 TaxID=2929486 RepID=UPI002000851F|nr:hypothetical protein [Maribellus sp. YY47]MCK3685412.1 hypothetical protein [Maribellus sp. YY47]
MKKLLFILFVLLFSSSQLFCQDVVIVEQISEDSTSVTKPSDHPTFYIQNTEIDSSIFENDSILLSKSKSTQNQAKIELYSTSDFCLFYNIRLEILSKEDEQTGAKVSMAVLHADQITGRYSLPQICHDGINVEDKMITLSLKDGETLKYNISKNGDSFVWKRSK